MAQRIRKLQKANGGNNASGRQVLFNPKTGIARIINEPLNDSVVGSLIGATPYGAAAKGILNIGKAIFGKKGSTTQASGTAGVQEQAAAAAAAKAAAQAQKDQILKLQTANKNLKMQRYYYGGAGVALGLGVGYMLKKS